MSAPPPIPVLESDDSLRASQRKSIAQPSAAKPATTVTPTATAPTIKRWLQPGTLRAQFILTEVFQPPLALRDERV